MSNFKLGLRSRYRLRGVHTDLVLVVQRALQISDIDFSVIEGLRSNKRQRALVAAGASRTMRSYHITGHAVDLAAYVGGRIRWDWPLYYKLAYAMRQAAIDLKVRVVWGGCWRCLNDVADLEGEVYAYVQRKRQQKKSPLLDGPHFQIKR